MKTIKHSGSPTPTSSGNSSSLDTTPGLTASQSWELLCAVQSDMRRSSKSIDELKDVSKSTLEVLQEMARGIRTLVGESEKLTAKVEDMNSRLDGLVSATSELVEENTKATKAIQQAVTDNANTSLDILEGIETLVLTNQQHIDQMSGDAEVLIKSSATLAISQVENLKFDEAATEAEKRLADDFKFAAELKKYVNALRQIEIKNSITKKYQEKREQLKEGN